MSNQKSHKTISISVFGYDDKQMAAVNYAFKAFPRAKVKILPASEVSEADILLFDVDSKSAKEQLDIIHSKQTTKPIITISYAPFEFSEAINILKPINSNKLFATVEQGLKLLSKQQPDSNNVDNKKVTPQSAEPQKAVYKIDDSLPAAPDKILDRKSGGHYFNCNGGLLGALAQLYKENQAACIDLNQQQQKILYIMPQTNRVYICISLSDLQTICKKQTAVSYSKIELNNFSPDKISGIISKAHLDRFIWQIALLTSNGRIPKTVNQQNSRLSLKYWPNLTRYKSNIDFIRFAAFFSQTPANLVLAEKLLNPKPRQLFQFVSACHALGILTISESTQVIDSPKIMPQSPKRNVITQIFKHLTKIMK
ncbi:MAG: hypothetical protein IME94_11000 [Proteobacteria bacterium]|nr:hypothetical protein [Pseudomonadota bacterium]